jgi:hypothetical protein
MASQIDQDRELTPHQVEAIVAVMRLFVDDDLANGVAPLATRACDACRQQRPAPGFVRYEDRALCNLCATEYEVRRARGLSRSIGVYLDQFRERHGA